MADIQVNGYVRVPKGTMVYPTGDGVEAPTTRAQLVKVAKIVDMGVKSDNFYLLLPDDMRLRYLEASGRKQPIDQDILDFTDRLTKGDYRAVQWSSKWALIAEVEPAEAPARARTSKTAGPTRTEPLTKLDQMVVGSVWRFTQDAELRYKVRNPDYANLRGDVESSLRQQPSHLRTQTVDAMLTERGVVDYLDEPWGKVKAGETFTVRSKLTSGLAGGHDIPMLFRGEKFTLPYASLEPVVELVTAP